MKEFKVGQVVKVLDNSEACAYNLHNLLGENIIGKTFTVERISEFEDDYGNQMAKYGDWNVPIGAVELSVEDSSKKTPFQRVAEMNEAFGNPKGDFQNIDWNRIRAQCKNIFDEYCELLLALGQDAENVKVLKDTHNDFIDPNYNGVWNDADINVKEVRDALCDIPVFSGGAQHLMGVNADDDMHAVIDGVFTRFIKDEADKEATIALHAAKGVTDVYFEGEYPKLVMKSASDQPDAPKGKFLKSASYTNTVFPEVA